MSDSPSARLRDATATLHRRVEDRVDILRRTETVAATVDLLLRMEAFYRALETRLVGFPEEYREPRAPRLRADLDVLAPGWTPLPEPSLPDLEDPLGSLYVLEGAALGGQIIGRHLLARLGHRSAFFREGAGPRWRTFRAFLDETSHYEAVERTAVATFLAFEAAVVAEPSHV